MIPKEQYERITAEMSQMKMAQGGDVRSMIDDEMRMRKVCKAHNCSIDQYRQAKKTYGDGGNIAKENRDMVANNNKQIAHHTKELEKALGDGKSVPAWVVAKVNRSASDLSDVTHYLDGSEDKMAKGGNVHYFQDKDSYRLGRPYNIDKDLLNKVGYESFRDDFVGNFGWMTPYKKLADGFLFKLDSFDQYLVKDIKLKRGERIFRYFNEMSAIGGIVPIIKINLEKGLLYFTPMKEFGDDSIEFETKGVKAEWVNLIEDKMAKGGTAGNYYRIIWGLGYYEDYKTLNEALRKKKEFVDNPPAWARLPKDTPKIYRFVNGKIDYTETYAKGGEVAKHVDLFEHYEQMPPKIAKIFDKYWKKYGEDMDYGIIAKLHDEVYKHGYTFESGLDATMYGLRPIGVKLNQLEGYEDVNESSDDEPFAVGGMTGLGNSAVSYDMEAVKRDGQKLANNYKSPMYLMKRPNGEYVVVPKGEEMDEMYHHNSYFVELIRPNYAKGGTTRKEYIANKVGKVMHEFKEGELHSGSGAKVTDRKQAIAIGLSEGRKGWKHRRKK